MSYNSNSFESTPTSSSSMSPNKWNKSTYIHKPPTERRKMENYVDDHGKRFAYNYRAEELDVLKNPDSTNREHYDILVKTNKSMEEMPNSTKIHNKIPWNFECHYDGLPLLASKEMKRVYAEKGLKSMEWCKTRNIKMLPKTYVNPIESSLLIQENVRELKRNGTFKDQLSMGRTTTLSSLCSSSSNNELAMTRSSSNFARRMYTAQSMASSGRLQLIAKQQESRIYTVNKHSGTWEYNPIEKRHMWSDTGSFEYESKGDVTIKIDPDAYNYVDPTMNTTVHTVLR